MNKKSFRYTEEHIRFLADNIAATSIKNLAILFNKKFGYDKTTAAISTLVTRYKLANGIDERFKPGNKPSNYGLKFPGKVNRTSFKKGDRPKNFKEIGSERVTVDGSVMIKVKNYGLPKDQWKLKHRILWEETYGAIPDGHVLFFLDQNSQNCELDNLVLLKRGILATMTVKKMITTDPTLNKIAIKNAELTCKIVEMEKKQKRGVRNERNPVD